MSKQNCWEYKNCGLEPGGDKTNQSGVCPAAIPNIFDGVNNGKNVGRFCWAIEGTLCNNSVQQSFSNKLMDCINCDFLQDVQSNESSNFILTPEKARKANYTTNGGMGDGV